MAPRSALLAGRLEGSFRERARRGFSLELLLEFGDSLPEQLPLAESLLQLLRQFGFERLDLPLGALQRNASVLEGLRETRGAFGGGQARRINIRMHRAQGV